MLSKLTWYLKQLLPLTYRSMYGKDNETHFCVWNMWFGRSFNINDVVLKDNILYS